MRSQWMKYFVAVCAVPTMLPLHTWVWVLKISNLKHEIGQLSLWANVFSILSKFHLSKCPNEQNKIGQNILGKCRWANWICATVAQSKQSKAGRLGKNSVSISKSTLYLKKSDASVRVGFRYINLSVTLRNVIPCHFNIMLVSYGAIHKW